MKVTFKGIEALGYHLANIIPALTGKIFGRLVLKKVDPKKKTGQLINTH